MNPRVAFRNNILNIVNLNISEHRIFLTACIIAFEFMLNIKKQMINSMNDIFYIIIKDTMLLIIIPLIVSIIALFITYIYDRNKEKKLNEGYYRDIIKELSPVELSYIDDFSINHEQDMVSALLELQLKKKIKISNSTITIIDSKEKGLSNHEKVMLKELETNPLAINSSLFRTNFETAIIQDLSNSKLIDVEKEEKLRTLSQKIKFRKNLLSILMILSFIFFSFPESFDKLLYIHSLITILTCGYMLIDNIILFFENLIHKEVTPDYTRWDLFDGVVKLLYGVLIFIFVRLTFPKIFMKFGTVRTTNKFVLNF